MCIESWDPQTTLNLSQREEVNAQGSVELYKSERLFLITVTCTLPHTFCQAFKKKCEHEQLSCNFSGGLGTQHRREGIAVQRFLGPWSGGDLYSLEQHASQSGTIVGGGNHRWGDSARPSERWVPYCRVSLLLSTLWSSVIDGEGMAASSVEGACKQMQ